MWVADNYFRKMISEYGVLIINSENALTIYVASMHRSIHGCMHGFIHGSMHGCMHGSVHGSMHGSMHGAMHGCINYFFVSKGILYTPNG